MKFVPLSLALCAFGALASAEAPQFASQVTGLTIAPLTSLPKAPAKGKGASGIEDLAYCQHLFTTAPGTAAGRAVQAAGWQVTGEQAFGPYTAVSFVGAVEPATSGTCTLTSGNLGLYDGDILVGLVYGDDPAAAQPAYVEAFGPDRLRLFDGDLIPIPLADLRLLGGRDVQLAPPGPEQPVCTTAAVPTIQRLPITMARKLLADYGWQPVPAEAPGLGLAEEIAAAGVPEVEDCSGTGFAFCAYTYAGPAGTLAVVTAGEIDAEGRLPSVVRYSVTCAAK